MSVGTISMRYARALLSYAGEQGAGEAIYRNMLQLLYTLMKIKELPVLLRAPSLPKKERVKIICSAVENNPVFERFATLIVDEEREELLMFIAHGYISLYRAQNKILAVELTTAHEADTLLKEKIIGLMSNGGEYKVELQCSVDSSIIGGFICEANSTRLDASVARSLDNIRKKIVEENKKLV